MKRFGVTAFAVIAALALFGIATPAAFANEPGETDTWGTEIAGNQQINSASSVSEARDWAGNHAIVALDATGRITISYNNNLQRTWYNATTYASPRIISTNLGFRVFHTGTDGRIYFAGFEVRPELGTIVLGNWVRIPGNVLTDPHNPPGVTALLHNTSYEEWLLVWTGTDHRIYAQWHSRYTLESLPGRFDPPENLPDAMSNFGPAIAFSTVVNRFYVAWTGLDARVYSSYQPYSNTVWDYPTLVGGVSNRFTGVPAIGILGMGFDGQIVSRNARDNRFMISAFEVVNPAMHSYPWVYESTGWRSYADAALLAYGAYQMYLLATDTAGFVWYKQSEGNNLNCNLGSPSC